MFLRRPFMANSRAFRLCGLMAAALLAAMAFCACGAELPGEDLSRGIEAVGPDSDEESLTFIEIETDDMVEFSIPRWNIAASSLNSGIKIKYSGEDAVFEGAVEKGYFITWDQTLEVYVKEVTVKPGSTIYWHPSLKHSKPEQDFVSIILKTEGKITGYAVVGINAVVSDTTVPYGTHFRYELKLLHSALIPKVDGEYQNVSEEYVRAEIEKVKAESQGGDSL
jgi:hypothetical protein